MLESWKQPPSRKEFRFEERWPSLVNDEKYSIVIDSIGGFDCTLDDSVRKRLQQRKDIDCLVVELRVLSKNCQHIREILSIKDRDWSVYLQHGDSSSFLKQEDDGKLREALFALKDVTNLVLRTPVVYNATYHHYRILKNMPNFTSLNILDVQRWSFTQLDVEDIMDFPFARQLSMVSWQPVTSPTGPVFSAETSRRIRSVQLCMCQLNEGESLLNVNAVKELPALMHLHIDLPNLGTARFVEPISTLFQWLHRPDCTVVNLSIKFNHREQWPMVFGFLPKFPTIRRLKLIRDFCQRTANDVLRYQLDARPRMLTIRLDMVSNNAYPPSAVEKVCHVSRVYRTFQKIHRNRKYQTPRQLSAWPKVLEKLGKEMQVPSLTVRKVCADAMYHTLQRFFFDRWMVERPPTAPPACQTAPAKHAAVVGGPALRV